MGYSAWAHKELDTTEQVTHTHTHTHTHMSYMAFLKAQVVENLPAIWESWVLSLVWEDPLEKGWYPLQYSFRRTSQTEEPGGLQSMGLQRIRHN